MGVPPSRARGRVERNNNLVCQYKRLIFGISSAPEKYQKIVSDVIRGCNGVANIADGLIVHGADLEEHDRNSHAVLQRLRECRLTLNGEKCQLSLYKLTFFGHDLKSEGVAPSKEKITAVVNAKAPKNVLKVRSFVQLVEYWSTCQSSSPTFHKWLNLWGNYSGTDSRLCRVLNRKLHLKSSNDLIVMIKINIIIIVIIIITIIKIYNAQVNIWI